MLVTCCPGHADKHPSSAFANSPTVAFCFTTGAGCCEAILAGIALDYSVLFPTSCRAGSRQNERGPFIPSDVFEIVRQEIGVAAIIAADLHKISPYPSKTTSDCSRSSSG
jgi:hypothetical protein